MNQANRINVMPPPIIFDIKGTDSIPPPNGDSLLILCVSAPTDTPAAMKIIPTKFQFSMKMSV